MYPLFSSPTLFRFFRVCLLVESRPFRFEIGDIFESVTCPTSLGFVCELRRVIKLRYVFEDKAAVWGKNIIIRGSNGIWREFTGGETGWEEYKITRKLLVVTLCCAHLCLQQPADSLTCRCWITCATPLFKERCDKCDQMFRLTSCGAVTALLWR